MLLKGTERDEAHGEEVSCVHYDSFFLFLVPLP
jgi:hypothetical protein